LPTSHIYKIQSDAIIWKNIKVELTSHTLSKGFENQLLYRLSGLYGSLEIMSGFASNEA
jgi:hypothetical protein